MSNTVLVLSTWIDEVPLPAGGLMANHAAAGDRVIGVVACYPGYPSPVVYPEVNGDNPFGRFKTQKEFERQVMRPEVEGVSEALGMEKIITWDCEPLTGATFTDAFVARIAATLNEYQPDIVITHWPISDYTDFIGVTASLMRALIDKRLAKMPQVYFSETLTGRHTLCFVPSLYVDITKTIDKKKAACEKLWEGKVVDYFFNPFALPIAEFRGRECGVRYAEAYAALHGSFGIEKQPGRTPAPAGAHPMTMQRTVTLLQRGEFGKGVQPSSFGVNGIIDDDTAKKAFGL